jgi:hypothetical protein
MTDLLTPDDDFAAVADDDAFVSALAAGSAVDSQHPADALLARWRHELDAPGSIEATTHLPVAVTPARADHHWYRSRSAAGAAALLVVLATSTGVAAAVPGSPVHRALFGGTSTTDSSDTARITALLDEVAGVIESANTAGGIGDNRRAAAGDKLDVAAGLIGEQPTAHPALASRLSGLRAALAALPSLDGAAPSDEDAVDGGDDAVQQPGNDGSGEVAEPDGASDGDDATGDTDSETAVDRDGDGRTGSDDGSDDESAVTPDTDTDSGDGSTSEESTSDDSGEEGAAEGSDSAVGGISGDDASTEGSMDGQYGED